MQAKPEECLHSVVCVMLSPPIGELSRARVLCHAGWAYSVSCMKSTGLSAMCKHFPRKLGREFIELIDELTTVPCPVHEQEQSRLVDERLDASVW